MKYLSLFSGIGGFELGIQQAYETIRNTDVQEVRGRKKTSEGELQKDGERLHSIPSEGSILTNDGGNELSDRSIDQGQPNCVGYSEIDKYAIQIYEKNFNHTNYGDITKINAEELPQFDLLVGGFPCQAFSIAGRRMGFADTRGTLFFEIARIAKQKRPRLLLLENVKGLLSHDKGLTFYTVISTLDELGYDTQWQVLNSKNHGVPQNRERVFIIGHLRGTPRPEVLPFQGQSNEYSTESKSTETAVARTLTGGGNTGGNHSGMTILHNIYGGFKEGKARQFKDLSPTIRTAKGGGHIPSVLKKNTIRRLTPIECERLQGFPDDWTKWGLREDGEDYFFDDKLIEISDTQRYKTLGNAVTVNVIKDIMIRVCS